MIRSRDVVLSQLLGNRGYWECLGISCGTYPYVVFTLRFRFIGVNPCRFALALELTLRLPLMQTAYNWATICILISIRK